MNISSNWDWKTHQPLIRTILKNYNPEYILEIGVGNFSTPLFIEEYKPKNYCGIENDFAWFSSFKEKYPNNIFLFHEIKNTNLATKVFELNDDQKLSIVDYYKKLRSSITANTDNTKLLFVDNFSCARTFAVNNLFDLFDIVIIHDTEPAAYPWYSYYFDNTLLDQYKKIDYQTPISWATAFIKKSKFKEDSLKDGNIFVKDFENTNGVYGTTMVVYN